MHRVSTGVTTSCDGGYHVSRPMAGGVGGRRKTRSATCEDSGDGELGLQRARGRDRAAPGRRWVLESWELGKICLLIGGIVP